MITPKIKALFQFIEYLHSNIDNFNLNNDLIKELELLIEERQKVRSKNTFKDKLKYDEVQAEIETKFKILQGNTANLIKAKAKELNVCNFDNEPNYSFYGIETEIRQLKDNFSKDDLPEIFKHKQQYIEYRTKTHKTFLSLAFFIDELDKITKSLFDYFKETENNEFEAFEKKTIEVNSIEEAIQIFTNKGNKDERFLLTTFIKEQEQTKHEYKGFKREIENNGCLKVKTETDTVKIYTPELAVIFTSNKLSARNMDTQTETNINGSEYLKTYIEAYKEGEQYFETEFKVSTNTLYGANAEQYVRDIHLNFFHVQHTGINEGWSYVKKQYPIILTHKAVKEFGYYSGIVNKVEEQVKKYPRLFATFHKCEHNLPPQPIVKQKPEQETPKTFDELFYNTDLVKPCIDILKELDPPLIDTDCNYIGKLKGVFCVWIDEMQRQGIVKHYSDRKIFASLIPQKIKRFSIDESMFGKYQSKAENLYRTDIKTKVSNIKLSQNSQ